MISYQLTRFGGALERVESPPPAPEGTEVLLRTEACGVCHSDLHLQDASSTWAAAGGWTSRRGGRCR